MAAKSTRRELESLAEQFEERARSIRSVLELLNGYHHTRAAAMFGKKLKHAVKLSRNGGASAPFGPLLQSLVVKQPLTATELLEAAHKTRPETRHQAIGAALRHKWLRRVRGKFAPGKAKAEAHPVE